jgi:hypothetical protein
MKATIRTLELIMFFSAPAMILAIAALTILRML